MILPMTLSHSADVLTYPENHGKPPVPWSVPFPLKGLGSADCGARLLPDGRLCYWIKHDIVRGVTPRMLVWWFSHLEGDIEIGGRRVNRYRAWHPYDHVHASYAQRLPDGRIGPGAKIRLREYLNANPDYEVDTITEIEKLDESGFIHNPALHGISGLVRMEYTFQRVEGGTLYENCLLIGGRFGWRSALNPLVQRFGFSRERGMAWLRHNIEEVGLFEHILPKLYQRETGLAE